MNTEKTKDKRDKGGCSNFGSEFVRCQEIFEEMNKRCMGREGSIDPSAIMDRMMKAMMEMCCGAKKDETKSNENSERF